MGGLGPHELGLINEEDLPEERYQKPKFKGQKKFWEKKGTEPRVEIEWN